MKATDYAARHIAWEKVPPDLHHALKLIVVMAYNDGHLAGVEAGCKRMRELMDDLAPLNDPESITEDR